MKFLCSLVVAALCITAHAQDDTERNNAISMEIGKTGFIKSFTYDHRFSGKNVGMRALLGGNYGRFQSVLQVGGGLYGLIGRTNRYLEFGADVIFLNVWEDNEEGQRIISLVYPNYTVSTLYSSLNLGYRSYGEKTLFRFGFSPGVLDSHFVPGGYVSFGLTF